MDAATTARQDEDDRVYDFRRQRCRDLGLNFDQADLVAAHTNIDLHQFEDLLQRGCPIHIAFDICD